MFRKYLSDEILTTKGIDLPTKTWSPPAMSRCWWRKPSEPTRIIPITQPATGLGPNFTRFLPPFPITVLEIQCP